MRILYFGNDMTKHGKTPTGINFLGDALSEHYEVHRYSDKKNQWLRLFHMVLGLIKYGRGTDYSLIDTYSTVGFYYAFIISLISRLFNIPYVSILRGGNLPLRFERSQFISGIFLKNANFIVAPSEYLKKRVEKMGYKVIFIPNLIDLSEYNYKSRQTVRPRLVWIRSLKEIYNPKMAIQVLATLRKSHADATLCMIGPSVDDSETACLAMAKNLGTNGELLLTGMLSKPELKRVAAEYDIFINTTNVDNTPMSVLEAMALGLPVVSTNVGGIPYLVKDGVEGLLTPPGDHEAMAANIQRLLDDGDLTAMLTKNALEKAQVFDKKQVLEKWRAILK